RKPMVWEDMVYEDEVVLPDGSKKAEPDKVAVNKDLLAHYKKLIGLRNEFPALRTGSYETMLIDDEKQLYGYKRVLGEQEIIGVLNNSEEAQQAALPVSGIWEDRLSGKVAEETGADSMTVALAPRGAAVLVKQ
ncbi:MAG: alpha-glucosidase C-terminal domain-containing protein, partial [Chthoniobacterales bacterium]